MTFIFVFLVGLCVGSFLSVLVSRLDQKDGIISGRSECPKCHKLLAWYDLIPLVSFVLFRLRCRQCRSKISFFYPTVELITGIIFLALYIRFAHLGWPYLIISLIIASLLISLIFFDYFYFVIPDKIITAILILTLLLYVQFNRGELATAFITGLIMSAIFAIMYLVSQGTWIGLGDVKLIFTIGFLLGYPNGIIAIVGSIWLAALVGLCLLAANKATLKTAIPFGSFIAIISLITFICQNEIQKTVRQYFF